MESDIADEAEDFLARYLETEDEDCLARYMDNHGALDLFSPSGDDRISIASEVSLVPSGDDAEVLLEPRLKLTR